MNAERVSSDNLASAPADVEALRVVCAWCKKVLREGVPGATTSHGICAACREKWDGVATVNEAGEKEFLA